MTMAAHNRFCNVRKRTSTLCTVTVYIIRIQTGQNRSIQALGFLLICQSNADRTKFSSCTHFFVTVTCLRCLFGQTVPAYRSKSYVFVFVVTEFRYCGHYVYSVSRYILK